MRLEDVVSCVRRIEPKDAARLSERFYANTHVDRRLLDAYARDMREGHWLLNGAPIVMAKDGRVLDGRTRLLACVTAGVGFETLVVEGIEADSYETLDAVRKRRLADILTMRSEQHGRALGAALRIIWCYTNGVTPGGGKTPSPLALLELLDDNPSIRDSVRPALRATPLLPHGCGIALHHLMSRVDPRRADRFMSLIGEPIATEDISPVLQLRGLLQDLRGQGGNRKQTYILAVAVKALNAFLAGRPVKLLRYTPEREAFPRIEAVDCWGMAGASSQTRSVAGGSRTDRHEANARVRARPTIITPELATTLLESRGLHRRVSAPVLQKYARDMQNGRWRLNGQTIKISSDGRLLDGQHRLEAAKKANTSFPAIIVEGLDEATFSSVDIGHQRSVSDILRERGESSTLILASALRWLWMIRNKVVLAANSSPTNGELLQLLSENPGIKDSFRQVSSIRNIMGSGIATALHYTFSCRDATRADEFFARLIDGVNLSETSPVYHLRERLIRTRSSHRVRLAEAERVAFALKAWNAVREDRPMQLLLWRNRGASREALPEAV